VRPIHPPGRPNPWVEGETAAYHITHVENLASIVACGQLYCDNECSGAERNPVEIAYPDLKARRAGQAVEVAAGGTLADYVPFYFAPRSPMLYAISTGWVRGYNGPQEDILHLVCAVDELAEPGRFVITTRHPLAPLAEQRVDLDALDELDWPLMNATYWNDTDPDGDRKSRRQAEFLVHRSVPIEAIRLVGAMTKTAAARAVTLLDAMAHPPSVGVRKGWYY
jgi:ssDNA thymidine ADP-ribosyltransferase, DarT